MTMVHDVVILGGGPAGSAAARLLASWGHSVLVLSRGPARDAMAESLPPSAAKLLDRVGMLRAVEQANFIRSTGNTVRWGEDEMHAEYFANGALGWQLQRARFDELLLETARAAGATVASDVSVRHVPEPGSDGLRAVEYDDTAGRRTAHGRWVLDCTGRTGIVARRGWRRSGSAARTLAVVGVWEAESSWGLHDETHTIVESYDDGWAWSIPVSATQRYITVMVDPAHTAIGGGAELTATYRDALARTTAMRELARRDALVGIPFAREASPYSFARAGEDGILLVGDAASFVDPLSSFGIKKALASAWLAAVVTRAALRDHAITSAGLELYEAREREMHVELESQAATLARDAGARHDSAFWSDRSVPGGADHQLPQALTDATRAAFEAIRSRPSIALGRPDSLRYIPRAIVTGDELTVAPHLATAAMPQGMRFVRNIDVVCLAEMAESFDRVPDLYEAYNHRTKMTAGLSDFLAALATLVGTGALRLLDSPRGRP